MWRHNRATNVLKNFLAGLAAVDYDYSSVIANDSVTKAITVIHRKVVPFIFFQPFNFEIVQINSLVYGKCNY